MKEDVGLKLAEEEQRESLGIGAADGAGLHGPGEVVGEEAQHAAGRNLIVARTERHDDRRRVHLHGDGGTDDGAEKGDQATGEIAQRFARIRSRIELRESRDELRHDDGACAHGDVEQLLLGVEVPEDGRGSDVEHLGDVAEGGRGETASAEGLSGGVEDLFARDARWSSHDVSKRRFTN